MSMIYLPELIVMGLVEAPHFQSFLQSKFLGRFLDLVLVLVALAFLAAFYQTTKLATKEILKPQPKKQ